MAEFEGKKFSFIAQKIDRAKSRDTGLAATLVLLIAGLYFHDALYFKIATATLVLTMTIPLAYKPLGYLWFGFAHLLGTIVSKIILSLTFLVLVVPVGLLRRGFGKDNLKLKQWKKSSESVFMVRNHKFTPNDIDKPY